MRGLTRNVASLAIAAVLVLAGTIIATSALGSPGGDSTGPGTSGSPGHAAAVATTNTAPVPTFQPSPAGSIFVPITPCRIIDTRVAGGKIAAGSTRNFQIRGTTGFAAQGGPASGCGIPASASAVTGALTATQTAGVGFLRAGPYGRSALATVLNYPATTGGITSETTLALGAGAASISIKANGHATHVVLDVTGYYNSQIHLIILADGTVWYGTGAHLTSLVHDPNSGLYELTFDRSLDGCNVLTTSNDQRDVQAVGAWGGSTLDVSTSHEAGGVFTSQDESFQLSVIC